PLARPGVVRPPLARILSGAVWASGDRSVELILANSDPADPGILWGIRRTRRSLRQLLDRVETRR
ncbi:hypothetical protein, partial [Salinibacterium sp.]|uniref:hypothetical protein n=1 Tax=Salinibacterium sp. TaxID=1915057 RepID=UPI00286B331E